MIYSQIGKKFINYLNQKEKTNYSAKSFFVEVYLPLFFGDEKTLLMIGNSPPFFETIIRKSKAKKENKEYVFSSENIINDFNRKIKNGDVDASVMPDGGAKDMLATTSFNISLGINHKITEETVCSSWIGYSLAIQLNNITFVLNDIEILYLIYQGWKYYRKLLSDPIYEHCNGNQIHMWNAHWLMNDCELFPKKMSAFNPLSTKLENKSLKSVSWVELIFKLARKYPDKIINTYASKYDKTNETYGFIPIKLNGFSNFLSFCKEYFGDNDFLNKPELYNKLFGSAYSLRKICEFGSIGLFSIKPELLKLEQIKNKSEQIRKKINTLTKQYAKNNYTLNLYKLYIMTMLNTKNIQQDSKQFAEFLVEFKKSKFTKSEGEKLVNEFFECKTINGVVEVFTKMSDQKLSTPQQRETITKLLDVIINNEKNLTLLISFIKFTYTTL